MRRDVDRLASDSFDVLVVGGGIHGACIAWDATLRGLRVALVEQRDFGAGTTANSLRIAHGGLRSLQQRSISRLRRSAREQHILFRLAPSLVQPLPCLVPLYRGSSPSAAAFRVAFAAGQALTSDIRRRFGSPLPAPRLVSRAEALACFEGFDSGRLDGGALWYDAQVPDIERLVLAMVRSATARGAVAANYVRARRPAIHSGVVGGIEATDQLTGRDLSIRATQVINAAGPWAEEFADRGPAHPSRLPRHWAQGVNVILQRVPPPVAVGVRSPWEFDRDPVMGGRRYLFLTPWHGATLAGTSYRIAAAGGPSLAVQVRELVDEWKQACPGLDWKAEEVTHYHCGRLPIRDGFEPGRSTALLEAARITEHARDGLDGMISVTGTKFTTARQLAEEVVNRFERRLRGSISLSGTADVPLDTGRPQDGEIAERVRDAIREDMAVTLEDLVLRRLGLGLAHCPPVALLGQVADVAGAELGWTPGQADEEVQRVLGRFLPAGLTRAA